MRPDFIDNQDGNHLSSALNGLLEALRKEGKSPSELCIATAYFSPRGLRMLAAETEHVPAIRLLLGAEPTPERSRKEFVPGDLASPQREQTELKSALTESERKLAGDRDRLPFSPETDSAIKFLVEALQSGKLVVRRYEKAFLHAKAYLIKGSVAGVITGSSNLTPPGMRFNRELNLGIYDTPLSSKVHEWYEKLWIDAEPYDLAALYEASLATYSPYLVYLRVLFEIYGKDVVLENENDPRLFRLTNFQRHGVFRAIRLIDTMGGALVADSVGLGKTFIAGEVIRRFRERRQRVLLIRPKSLEATWDKYLLDSDITAETISYEELSLDKQLNREKGRERLKYALDDYELIVVDEAHNYRNPDASSRAGILRGLLAGPRKRVLLLTATPVNNSLWDLYHLIHYFVRQDAALADRGILSIRDRFKDAMRVHPADLNPDELYPIIDATTVKRTRSFIKKHYSGDRIRMADGREIEIVFPKPIQKTIKYSLDSAFPGFFTKIAEALGGDDHKEPAFTCSRYNIFPFLKTPTEEDASKQRMAAALVGLIRSGLLKRFESSGKALLISLDRMIKSHDNFIKALDAGWVISSSVLKEFSVGDQSDFDEFIGELDENEDKRPQSEFRIKDLKNAVEADRELLIELASFAGSITKERDSKLHALTAALAEIAVEAHSEAKDRNDEIQKRKVIIFSYFTDTVDWIRDYLLAQVKTDPNLAVFRNRIATAYGGEDNSSVVHGFAPISTKSAQGDDLYDILICTDVLAEGMNLQQARHIINYDLPWNPMRLVQRHGRIDRIGSEHPKVFLRTIFPDDILEALLGIERRIRHKLLQAARSVGVETSPILDGAEEERSFAEAPEEIRKIYNEKSDIFELGGTESAAQTGEEYRLELTKALQQRRPEIEGLPWRVGTGFRKGNQAGFFFCARVGNDRVYLRFIPNTSLEPSENGEPTPMIRELGTCLRIIETTEQTELELDETLATRIYDAWNLACADIYKAWMLETDPANLLPKVAKVNQEAASLLRKTTPDGWENACNVLEQPWSERVARTLREVMNKEYPTPLEKAASILLCVTNSGLEPLQAPKVLPPIDKEDVRLVVWAAISTK
jgi:superfamily II DNA or RNA helicase